MFTLVGYSAVVAPLTLTALAALADQHLTVSGNNIVVPAQLNQIVGVYGVGANITDLQISTPSLRLPYLPNFRPLDRSATPQVPARFIDKRDSPLVAPTNENLNALESNDVGTTARVTVLVWLADGPIQRVSGHIIPWILTGTTTLTAGAWTQVALTPTQNLPSGTYAVVGMNAQSAGCIAARLWTNNYPWRPGVIGHTGVVDDPLAPFRRGAFGEFLRFPFNLIPNCEFLSNAADTAETVVLDLIKVA